MPMKAGPPTNLADNLAACAQAGVTLVEQPLPADADDMLARIARPLPVCADESVHARASLPALVGKYDAVNIKLDKTGGLTEALAMVKDAERLGFALMAGCMVATSLAIAPAILIAQRARVVDLDGALLLARDRPDGLRYEEQSGTPGNARAVGLTLSPFHAADLRPPGPAANAIDCVARSRRDRRHDRSRA